MTFVKLESVIKMIEDRFAVVPELTLEAAVAVAIALPEALRSLPTDDGVTDEMVERAARALAESDTELQIGWRFYVGQARAALQAALGPLPAPPSD